ncbi:MAG: sugar ABC transporter permease, partial [Ruminococcaceae bacterium]|nr:sugar ABC transporter permease [Oscillospiraceae bacterium]
MSVVTKIGRHLRKYYVLHLMALPAVVAVLVFSYAPKYGAIVAFQDINFSKGFFGSPFIGFKNFEFLFKTTDAWIITRNTVLYNIVFILLNTSLAVLLAIILNEVRSKRLAKSLQTDYMMPHFLSITAVSMMVLAFLSTASGAVSQVWETIGRERRNWYTTRSVWPGTLIFVNSWKNVGYSSIIYLASIAGISQEYYEAAMIDGATRPQQAFYIT